MKRWQRINMDCLMKIIEIYKLFVKSPKADFIFLNEIYKMTSREIYIIHHLLLSSLKMNLNWGNKTTVLFTLNHRKNKRLQKSLKLKRSFCKIFKIKFKMIRKQNIVDKINIISKGFVGRRNFSKKIFTFRTKIFSQRSEALILCKMENLLKLVKEISCIRDFPWRKRTTLLWNSISSCLLHRRKANFFYPD